MQTRLTHDELLGGEVPTIPAPTEAPSTNVQAVCSHLNLSYPRLALLQCLVMMFASSSMTWFPAQTWMTCVEASWQLLAVMRLSRTMTRPNRRRPRLREVLTYRIRVEPNGSTRRSGGRWRLIGPDPGPGPSDHAGALGGRTDICTASPVGRSV